MNLLTIQIARKLPLGLAVLCAAVLLVMIGGQTKSKLEPAGLLLDRNPVMLILTQGYGASRGDSLPNTISSLTTPDELNLLWRTGEDNEAEVDFWLLQMRIDRISEHHLVAHGTELRWYAYYHRPEEAGDICDIARIVETRVVVHTRDASLVNELNAACGGEAIEVRGYRE